MGSLSSLVAQIWQNRLQVAYRAPEDYAVGAHDLFNIVGGPVIIMAMFARFTAAETTGATFEAACAGVDMQAAAVDVDGAINTLAMFPLSDEVGAVIIPAVLAGEYPTVGAVGASAGFGMLSSIGDIVLTVAVDTTDGLPEFYVVYQAMLPAATINVA